jgi:phosphoribosylanthranilate isomerase
MFAHKDFKRVQLNVSPYEDIYMSAGHVHSGIDKEIIIQQKSPTMMYSKAFDKFLEINPELNVTMLVDPSGGRGISEGLDIIATDHKTGYAGGINESNVYDKLYTIMSLETVGDVWIDMESGVRTDDWFDIDKVVRVLEKCEEVSKEFKK